MKYKIDIDTLYKIINVCLICWVTFLFLFLAGCVACLCIWLYWLYDIIKLFIYKRLVDLNYKPSISTYSKEMITYCENQGYVKMYLKYSQTTLKKSIIDASKRDKLLYVQNALNYTSFRKIISLYSSIDKKYYGMLTKKLFKDYTVLLFLNHLRFDDIKNIIYKYYILMINDK